MASSERPEHGRPQKSGCPSAHRASFFRARTHYYARLANSSNLGPVSATDPFLCGFATPGRAHLGKPLRDLYDLCVKSRFQLCCRLVTSLVGGNSGDDSMVVVVRKVAGLGVPGE